jgi:hypothetical protein
LPCQVAMHACLQRLVGSHQPRKAGGLESKRGREKWQAPASGGLARR